MNSVDLDGDMMARLKRLDASGADVSPGYDYQGMLDRHAARKLRARRRASMARGTAGALVMAMLGVSLWRLDRPAELAPPTASAEATPQRQPEQRLVRADTYLALAAIEDHIASIDDALSDVRMIAPHGESKRADVARLERTRAELLDSYARVRYADMVAANF
jgi:hypothetical protein